MPHTIAISVLIKLPDDRIPVIQKVLQTLDTFPFGRPHSCILPVSQSHPVQTHSELENLISLSKSIGGVRFLYEGDRNLYILLFEDNIGLEFNTPFSSDEEGRAIEIIRFFAKNFTVSRATATLDPGTYEFIKANYSSAPRAPFSHGLIWLQYWDPREVDRQGGEAALLACPAIQCEKIGDGLLVLAGESALDVLTPEGQQRLINATKSLPPPNFTWPKKTKAPMPRPPSTTVPDWDAILSDDSAIASQAARAAEEKGIKVVQALVNTLNFISAVGGPSMTAFHPRAKLVMREMEGLNVKDHFPQDGPEWGLLPKLRRVYLGQYPGTQLPPYLAQAHQVTDVFFTEHRGMDWQQASSVLAQMQGLYILWMDFLNLTTLPESIAQLSQLNTLGLTGNKGIDVQQVAEVISQMPNLKFLRLEECDIRQLPEDMSGFKHLRFLWLTGNPIEALPASLQLLSNLQEIGLSYTPFSNDRDGAWNDLLPEDCRAFL